MAIGDLYRITDEQIWSGAGHFFNVYHYLQTSGGAQIDDLASAFLLGIVEPCRDIQSNAVLRYQILIQNLADPAEFKSFNTYPSAGRRGGEKTFPFLCWAFKGLRPSRIVRHGWKRISGISESDLSSGTPTSEILAKLNIFASKLGANIAYGGASWQPRIYSRKLGESYPAQEWAYVHVGSQVSRKWF